MAPTKARSLSARSLCIAPRWSKRFTRTCRLPSDCCKNRDAPNRSELIMEIRGSAAIVTGGASGLGAATARMLAEAVARVAILDVNHRAAAAVAIDINGIALDCDVTDGAATAAASPRPPPTMARRASSSIAPASGWPSASSAATDRCRLPISSASCDQPHRHVQCAALAAAAMRTLDPLEDGERGTIVCTASVAAFEGRSARPPTPPRKAASSAWSCRRRASSPSSASASTPSRPAYS